MDRPTRTEDSTKTREREKKRGKGERKPKQTVRRKTSPQHPRITPTAQKSRARARPGQARPGGASFTVQRYVTLSSVRLSLPRRARRRTGLRSRGATGGRRRLRGECETDITRVREPVVSTSAARDRLRTAGLAAGRLVRCLVSGERSRRHMADRLTFAPCIAAVIGRSTGCHSALANRGKRRASRPCGRSGPVLPPR